MIQDRVMIFDPIVNSRFIKNFSESTFQWTGDDIGDITNMLNSIPAIKGVKLFHLYPANQYVILKKYEPRLHMIELMKRFFGLNLIPYNLCTYRKKQYIMYLYVPFHEVEYNIRCKKKDEITDDERKIYFFHSILGIKGKMVKIYTTSTDGTIQPIILSNGNYSTIDYKKNEMTSFAMSKFFGNYHVLYNISLFFKDQEKVDGVRSLMTTENYWWFQEIEKRIEQIVPIN